MDFMADGTVVPKLARMIATLPGSPLLWMCPEAAPKELDVEETSMLAKAVNRSLFGMAVLLEA
jgi:hypothetical protein